MIAFYNQLSPAIKASIIVFIVLSVVTLIIGIKAKDLDPKKTPKGIMFLSVFIC